MFLPEYLSPGLPQYQQPGSAASTHSTSQVGHQMSGRTSTATNTIFPVVVDMPFEVSVDPLIEPVHLLVDPLNRPGDPGQFAHVRRVLIGVRFLQSSEEPHHRSAD